jgi:hypothetical protein
MQMCLRPPPPPRTAFNPFSVFGPMISIQMVPGHAQSNRIPTSPSPKPKASDLPKPPQLIRKTWPPTVSQATRTGKSRYGSPPYLRKHQGALSGFCVCQLCSRHRDMKNKINCKGESLTWSGRAEMRTLQNDRNQCPNGMRHHQQHLLGAVNSKRPTIDASPQGKHDQVCTSRCLMNQNSGLKHSDRGLLHSENQTAGPGMGYRSNVFETPIRLQTAIKQALLQSDLLGVSCRSASFLTSDWLRDLGGPLCWPKAAARQTRARAIPAGQNATEFIQTALATTALPVCLRDLLLRNAGETGRCCHARHQVHPIEIDHFVLGTLVGEAPK